MRHLELIFKLTGQSIYFDVPEGRPTATPTVQVFLSTNTDDGVTEAATTGSVSLDSVNTTLSSGASAGANTLVVASATGITRGRRYLITDTDGDQEWIEVIALSGTTVTTRQPLVNNYASSSTFVGTRISIAISDSWVSDLNKLTDVFWEVWRTDRIPKSDWPAGSVGYRARWAYQISTTNYIGASFFDVVRYTAKQLVTPLAVDRRFPGWIDRLPPDYREDQGVALIAEALQAVKLDALGDAQVIRRFRETEILHDLVALKANVLALEAQVYAGSLSNTSAVELAEKRYQQRYDQLLREPKMMVDQTASGASAQPQRLPITQR